MSALEIAKEFRSNASFRVDDEVKLFRKLSYAIAKHTKSVFVDETHGAKKCNVEFVLTNGKVTCCEIADLLIISKSNKYPFLRATFWQAKRQDKSKWISQAATDKHIDFRGQFNQWDLLSRRPILKGVSSFNPPADVLSCGSPSIGSFGIFYERASNLEVFYSVAELIGCASPSKHPTMIGNAHLEKYSYCYGEALVRHSLQGFIGALLNHQIGSPLSPSIAAHRWLASYARGKAISEDLDITGFFEEFDGMEDLKPSSRDGISILFVVGITAG